MHLITSNYILEHWKHDKYDFIIQGDDCDIWDNGTHVYNVARSEFYEYVSEYIESLPKPAAQVGWFKRIFNKILGK